MAGRKKKSDKAKTEAESVTVNDTPQASEETQDESTSDVALPEEAELVAKSETETVVGPDDTGEQTEVDPEKSAAGEAEETDTPASDASEDADITTSEDVDVKPIEPARPTPASEPIVVRKGGFFPMLLGGVAAAAIGFGLARYVFPENWPSAADANAEIIADLQSGIDGQAKSLKALDEQVTALGEGPDLSGVEGSISDHAASISSLSDRLSAMEDQLSRIESRPVGEGVSDAAFAAYEREMESLRSDLDAQSQIISGMTATAATIEANAQTVAQDTLRRAALTRIQTALDAGTGFAAPLTDLQDTGVSVPETLQQTSGGGVASLADLQDSFPEAARAALTASRASSESDSGGFTSFLRDQLGARSLEPRDGNDPDAVLSRVEAATKDGRLTDALAELEALPAEGRDKLSDWADRAAHRLEAVSAVQQLSEQLN